MGSGSSEGKPWGLRVVGGSLGKLGVVRGSLGELGVVRGSLVEGFHNEGKHCGGWG